MNNMKKSFTLAETLLTMIILGVIATITIPNLKLKVHDYITSVKVCNTYKLLEESYRLARTKNGDIKKWDIKNEYKLPDNQFRAFEYANIILADVKEKAVIGTDENKIQRYKL